MQASPTTMIQCPVCACGLAGPVDICALCRTPHHQDCARFIGRCAVFGCGGESFAACEADAVVMRLTAEGLDGNTEPAPTPRLRRGIAGRIVAAARLLGANPSIALSLAGVTLLFSLPFGGALSIVGNTIVQALLVVLLVSRSRGKDSTLGQAFTLVSERGWRILRALVTSHVLVTGAFLGGLTLCGVGIASAHTSRLLGAVLGLFGLAALWQGIRWMFAFLLVPVLSALDETEEPGSLFQRSSELARVGIGQLVRSFCLMWLVLVSPFVLIDGWCLEYLASTLYLACISLAWTTYLVLYYLEARQVLAARAREAA